MKTRSLIFGSLVLTAAGAFADEAQNKRKDRKDPGPSVNDRIELEVLFKRLDKDRSRSLSLDEFKQVPAMLKDPSVAEETFAELDQNDDQALNLREFRKFTPPPRKPPEKGDKGPSPEEIFKKLDADQSATLSLDEFLGMPIGKRDAAKAEEVFHKLDTDGDGSLTLEEFRKHFTPPEGGGRGPNPEEIFKKLDADESGSLSLDEFKGLPIGKRDPAKAEEVFAKLDVDGDDSLNLEEFKKHFPPPPPKGGDRKPGLEVE